LTAIFSDPLLFRDSSSFLHHHQDVLFRHDA
jgi:hypothetical protein